MIRMPPHQRPTSAPAPSRPGAPSGMGPPQGNSFGPTPASLSRGDVQAIMSQISQLAQAINITQNNQRLLGNTLVSLGGRMDSISGEVKRLKDGSAGNPGAQMDSVAKNLASFANELSSLRQSFNEVQDRLAQLSDHYASREDVAEIKYVMNAINPLEYATIKQVEGLVERKVREEFERSAKTPK